MPPQANSTMSLFEDFTEQQGTTEDESDIGQISSDQVSNAVVFGTDWTTETILSQINKGNIVLDPDFQRREAWNSQRKSAFIESLILGLPIPAIVLAESKAKKGSFIVIDGKQRLLTIRQFTAQNPSDELKIEGLRIRTDLNGRTVSDIMADPDLAETISQFENQTLRTTIVKNWPSEDFLYDVFLRVNTGSLPLSPQELRQALSPGPFVKFIDYESAASPALRQILNIDKPDFRMRDAELLLRFYAFKYFLPEYRGNLKDFLDSTCKKFNREWVSLEIDLKKNLKVFETSHETTVEIFGENAYRRYSNLKYESRFNRAVFDIMVFYFSQDGVASAAIKEAEGIRLAFEHLCEANVEFTGALVSTTKSREATRARYALWGNALRNILNLDIPVRLP